jgi:hypothetical protein
MKKLFLLIASLILSFQVFGTEITIEQARQFAEIYLNNNPSFSLKRVSGIELKDAGNIFDRAFFNNSKSKSTSVKNRDIYIFNIGNNNGFIIISGDDAAIPVIGYANSGSIDIGKLPQNMVKWIEGYKQQILYIKANNIQSNEKVKDLWSGKESLVRKNPTSVSPLLSTEWNQAPYVNAQAPFDETYSELTVVGCPATAMAQIMKYWEYPAKGYSFHSYQHNEYGTLSANFGTTFYDWDSMPDTVTGPNDAIATLMYHCGVAVEMNYNVSAEGGSGSYVIKQPSKYPDNKTVENALLTYFGYSSSIEGLVREDYSDNEWEAILKTELDAGRPIQYAGYGRGGHTFVCDGYDTNGYFNMNWGWGGYSDGYFLLEALNPGAGGIGGGGHSYNAGQQALIGIKPPDAQQIYALEIYSDVEIDKSTITYGEGFVVSTNIKNNGTNEFNGDYSAAIFDENDVFIDFVEIKTNNSLNPGNYYTNGLNFTTDGILSLLPGDYYIKITYKPSLGKWDFISASYWDFFTNDSIELEVVNQNTISLYSTINIETNDVYQNSPISVSLDIANYSTTDFLGIFNLSLFSLEGDFITTIEEKLEMSLSINSHYSNGLNFSTNNLDVAPGTYLMALFHQRNEGDYELTGSDSDYTNPIKVIVREAPYQEDTYENNNTIGNSYPFTGNYNNNVFNIETTSSNIHIGSDWDFYSIDLETDYDYAIDIRLNDSFSSSNGISYTLDGLFLYSLDGTNWSDVYDDIMPTTINTSGNKTLYCVVSPYFLGETGSYLLDINIQRSTTLGINEVDEVESFSLYPNPTRNVINFDNSQTNFETLEIHNVLGQSLLKINLDNSNQSNINISEFDSGVYTFKFMKQGMFKTIKVIKN